MLLHISIPCALSRLLGLCVLQRSWCQQEAGEPQKSSRAHDPPVVPFALSLAVKSPFSSSVTSVQRLAVFYGELSFKGKDTLQSSFLFFPSDSVRKARASLSLLSLKCHVFCAIPSFSFGKERKAGLLCCTNSRPHSLRMPCVALWSQTHF